MPRQRKRRTIRPEPDEVADLFQLLLDQAAPSTPKQWFEAPWREGSHAIKLGGALLGLMLPIDAELSPLSDVISLAYSVPAEPEKMLANLLYWHAQNLKAITAAQVPAYQLANEALELIQKRVSNSDGGGFGYNGPLLRMCEAHLASGGTLEGIEPVVRRWRARDVVGEVSEDGDPLHQKRLRAFLLAWNRGLYRIAAIV